MADPNAYINGFVTFTDQTENHGNVREALFSGEAKNIGVVVTNATFTDNASNEGDVTNGIFLDTSTNPGSATVATFEDGAVNTGTVETAIFNGTSSNQGTVTVKAIFNDTSTNTGGTVSGTALFADQSSNDGGSVTGSAYFDGTAIQGTGSTGGTLTPTVTFNPYTDYELNVVYKYEFVELSREVAYQNNAVGLIYLNTQGSLYNGRYINKWYWSGAYRQGAFSNGYFLNGAIKNDYTNNSPLSAIDNGLEYTYVNGISQLVVGSSGYFSTGYFVAGVLTPADGNYHRAEDNNKWYLYSISTGGATLISNGYYDNVIGDSKWYGFISGVETLVPDGYSDQIVGDNKWYNFADGVETLVSDGYYNNVVGDNKWYSFTGGSETLVADGYYNNIVGDNKWYSFTGGSETLVSDGYYDNIVGDNKWYSFSGGVETLVSDGYYDNIVGDNKWYNFASGVATLVSDGYYDNIVGDNKWYSFSGGTETLVSDGYYNNVVGDNKWYSFTGGVEALVSDGYYDNIVGDNKWYSFTGGIETLVADGYYNNVVGDNLWYVFVGGSSSWVPDGYSNLIVGDNKWYGFASGVATLVSDGYHNDVVGDTKWYSFTSGVAALVSDGYSNSITGDSLWYNFTGGYPILVPDAYSNSIIGDNLWYQFVSGVGTLISDGYYDDVVGDSKWYNFISGAATLVSDGYRSDVVGDGLWYGFSSGAATIVADGYYNNVVGDSKWYSFSGGVPTIVSLSHHNDIIGDSKWYYFNEGVASLVIDGYSNQIVGDGLWYNFSSGVALNITDGYYNNITGDSLWYQFVSNSATLVADGYYNNIVGDNLWYSLSSGSAITVTGYSNTIVGDNKWYWFNYGAAEWVQGYYNDIIPQDNTWYFFASGQESPVTGIRHVVPGYTDANYDFGSGSIIPVGVDGYNSFEFNSGETAYTTLSESISSSDFTIEFWIKPTLNCITNVENGDGDAVMFEFGGSTSDGKLTWAQGLLNCINFTHELGPNISSPIVTADRWNYITVTRTSGQISVYVDSDLLLRFNDNTSFNQNLITFGGGIFEGKISNVRIVKGAALYADAGWNIPTSYLGGSVSSGEVLTLGLQSSALEFEFDSNYTLDVSSDDPWDPVGPIGQWYADSSSLQQTITPNNFVSQGDGGYGVRYASIPDSGKFTTTLNDDLGNGDFTIETFIQVDSYSGGHYIVDSRLGSSWAFGIGLYGGTDTNLTFFIGGNNFVISSETMPNGWNHVAAVRHNNTITLYVNGVSLAREVDYTDFNGSGTLTIGSRYTDQDYLRGKLSNLRIVKGTAVYTADFNPPSVPLTDITGTKLLLKFESTGTPSTVITPHTYASFNGNGRVVATASEVVGTGDFTVEAYVRPQSFAENANLVFELGPTAENLVELQPGGSAYGPGRIITDYLIINKWNHVALVRENQVLSLYINGVSTSSVSDSSNITDPTVYIGRYHEDSWPFHGSIGCVRMSNIARYTQSFNPPALPFVSDINTILLALNSSILESSVTVQSGVVLVGIQVLTDGRNSVYMNASDSSLIIQNNTNFNFRYSDFTIEMFFYTVNRAASQSLYSDLNGTDHTFGFGLNLGGGSTGKIQLYASSDTGAAGGYWDLITCDTSSGNGIGDSYVPEQSWNHIVVQRSGSKMSVYLNGILDLTVNGITDAIADSATADKSIGNWMGIAPTTTYLRGSVSNVRIIKGQALYSGATITVPNAPLTSTGYGLVDQGITGAIALLACQSSVLENSITAVGSISTSTDDPWDTYSWKSWPFSQATYYTSSSDNLSTGVTLYTDKELSIPLLNANLVYRGEYFSTNGSGVLTKVSRWAPGIFSTASTLLIGDLVYTTPSLNVVAATTSFQNGNTKYYTDSNGTVSSSTELSYASLDLGYSGEYLYNSSQDWDLNTRNSWTIEGWIKLRNFNPGYPSSSILESMNDASGSHGWSLYVLSSGEIELYSGEIKARSSHPLVINTWYHVAVVYYNGNYSIYINGVNHGLNLSGQGNVVAQSTPYPLTVGKSLHTSTYVSGKLFSWRIVAQALYTEDFTVPSSPLTETGYGSFNQNITSEILLLGLNQNPIEDFFSVTGNFIRTSDETPWSTSLHPHAHGPYFSNSQVLSSGSLLYLSEFTNSLCDDLVFYKSTDPYTKITTDSVGVVTLIQDIDHPYSVGNYFTDSDAMQDGIILYTARDSNDRAINVSFNLVSKTVTTNSTGVATFTNRLYQHGNYLSPDQTLDQGSLLYSDYDLTLARNSRFYV